MSGFNVLIFSSSRVLLANPICFEEFVKMLCKSYRNINENNKEFLITKYDFYVENFDLYQQNRCTTILRKVMNLGKNASRYTVNFWIAQGWSKEEAIQKVSNAQYEISSVEGIAKRHNISLDEARKVKDSYVDKSVATLNARSDIDEINKRKSLSAEAYSKRIDPDTCDLYTPERAYEKYLEFYNRSKAELETIHRKVKSGELVLPPNNTTIEYYVNKGYSTEEAIKLRSERQATFTLKKCINTYGETKGFEIWKARQDKWQATLNSKSDDEKKAILLRKIASGSFVSKAGLDFCVSVVSEFPQLRAFYGDHEWILWNKAVTSVYKYDLCFPDLKLIIEYNGSHVHPNPKMWYNGTNSSWKHAFTKEDAYTVLERDTIKLQNAISKGFDVIVVWDDDSSKVDKIKKEISKRIIRHEFNN